MKTLKIFFLILLAHSGLHAQSTDQIKPALPDTFQNVLNLGQMTFTMPKDAIPVPVKKNKQMHYEYAVTFKDQPFEARYSVTPMGYSLAPSLRFINGVPHWGN